jgi:hypothetical protein
LKTLGAAVCAVASFFVALLWKHKIKYHQQRSNRRGPVETTGSTCLPLPWLPCRTAVRYMQSTVRTSFYVSCKLLTSRHLRCHFNKIQYSKYSTTSLVHHTNNTTTLGPIRNLLLFFVVVQYSMGPHTAAQHSICRSRRILPDDLLTTDYWSPWVLPAKDKSAHQRRWLTGSRMPRSVSTTRDSYMCKTVRFDWHEHVFYYD